MSDWIELRAAGKLHGRLDPQRMILEVRQRELTIYYNLLATANTGRTVLEWTLMIESELGDLNPENICAMMEP